MELKSFAGFVASQFNFKDKPVGELQELLEYLVPGTSYKVKINPKIANLNGNLADDSKLEGKVFQAPELSATTSFRAKKSGINNTPIIPLMFNYEIGYSFQRNRSTD